jgi:hypothetical protein
MARVRILRWSGSRYFRSIASWRGARRQLLPSHGAPRAASFPEPAETAVDDGDGDVDDDRVALRALLAQPLRELARRTHGRSRAPRATTTTRSGGSRMAARALTRLDRVKR